MTAKKNYSREDYEKAKDSSLWELDSVMSVTHDLM